jgi:superfamily I DNA/RNA helicase
MQARIYLCSNNSSWDRSKLFVLISYSLLLRTIIAQARRFCSEPSRRFLLDPKLLRKVSVQNLANFVQSSLSQTAKVNQRRGYFSVITYITTLLGLEFDDILLYNFFATSELLEAWDFIHGFPLKKHRSQAESAPPPSLSNELKLLYVAITRARKRCWIWDHGYVIDAMKVRHMRSDRP